MTDIKERIEKLIGDGPDTDPAVGYIARDVHDGWSRWREALIDRLAENARIVYSNGESTPNKFNFDEYEWANKRIDSDTHVALLLDIQPIRKGVTKSEILDHLKLEDKALKLFGDHKTEITELINRIESEGVIND